MNKVPVYLAALIFAVMLSLAAWDSNHNTDADNRAAAPPHQIMDLAAVSSTDQLNSPAASIDEPQKETPSAALEAAQKEEKSVVQTDGTSTPKQQSVTKTATEPPQVSRAKSQVTDVSKYPLISEKRGIYGQFRYRELGAGRIEIDPVWVAENIVYVQLAGVNRTVPVHRLARDKFIKAFTTIANGTVTVNGRKVSLLSQVKTFDGTWVARHVNWTASRGLSNHSWGIAVDINAANHFRYVNPQTEPNDPNLILWQKAFQPAGFKWGNSYADAMHFELY